jgi:hypothetical protein
MEREVTINAEQKLYVIPESGGGYTCLGFDVAWNRANAVWDWIARDNVGAQFIHQGPEFIPAPDPALIGTVEGYADYLRLLKEGERNARIRKTFLYDWDAETPQAVKDALLTAKHNGQRVRLFYGDRVTGRDWGEENDVTDTVSASTGWFKCLILLANSRSSGGPAILTGSIVRLLVDGREVYRHPTYTAPNYRIRFPADQPDGLPVRVDTSWGENLSDWSNVANFATQDKALRWIDFMRGRRMGK